jgi:hypothetical protein
MMVLAALAFSTMVLGLAIAVTRASRSNSDGLDL